MVVRNLGLQSRQKKKKNKIWEIITATLSSLYSMELENIKERTTVGRMVYIQNGGKVGRPNNSVESHQNFLKKKRNQDIIKYLERGMTYNEIAKIVGCSTKTISKVKSLLPSN